jgi:hypothetical protein
MFLHAGVFHLLFNMLALWMFGTRLEQAGDDGTFLKFYFVTGIGAAVLTILFSLLPFDLARKSAVLECHRRVRRDLRAAARLRTLFPRRADLHVSRVSNSGEILRDDHRRAGVLFVADLERRRRERDAPRWLAGGGTCI